MTKIIFDIKRDNGYGKQVYLKGLLTWQPVQNSTTQPKPNMSFELGSGPIEFSVEATDGTFLWTVNETVFTSGGSNLSFERTVAVPDSAEPINYIDLEDVSPSVILSPAENV